jgi:hypothetical protein
LGHGKDRRASRIAAKDTGHDDRFTSATRIPLTRDFASNVEWPSRDRRRGVGVWSRAASRRGSPANRPRQNKRRCPRATRDPSCAPVGRDR